MVSLAVEPIVAVIRPIIVAVRWEIVTSAIRLFVELIVLHSVGQIAASVRLGHLMQKVSFLHLAVYQLTVQH